MTLKIMTDSTCDLPKEVLQQLQIEAIPSYINFGDQSFLDGIDISRKEFYQKLPRASIYLTTSAPGIDTFIKGYRRLVNEGASHILSFHISTTLSNAGNVAKRAKKSDDSFPVTVIDRGQHSLGTGLIIKAAAEAAQAGKTLKEILELIKNISKRVYTIAGLETTEYLKRSGRVSHLAYRFTSMLNHKPIMKVHNEQTGIDLVRTRKRSIDHLIDMVSKFGSLEQLKIVHTGAAEQAEDLFKRATHLFPPGKDPIFAEVTPVIGAHIGPGAVGFVAVKK